MLERDWSDPTVVDRLRGAAKRAGGELVRWAWDGVVELGAIGPDSRRGRRFGRFGERSVICFPPTAIVNERYIHIGDGTMIGPNVSLSAGMVPGQRCLTDPVVGIGDRCLIGKGSGIVGHLSIEIGDDVWTGHHVYITDQNHGYEDVDLPISQQFDARAAGARSATARGSATARSCCPGPASAATSSSAPTRWSPATSPTSASPSAPRPGSIRRYVEGERLEAAVP